MFRCILLAAIGSIVLLQFIAPSLAKEPTTEAQQFNVEVLANELRQKGRVTIESMGVMVERADFATTTGQVEAIIIRPQIEESSPGLLLIAGHSRSAYDLLAQAIFFSRKGFVTMSVSQPGYGGSSGKPDFVGPLTFSALKEASMRLADLPYVEATRLGVYGYSRGALAAAQLATRTDLFHAAVFGGGVYDYRSALEQVSIPEIRQNMEAESGLSEAAIRFRSPVNDLEGLDGPVLIIHGELDHNAPLAQAHLLSERLTELGRQHEIKIIPNGTHSLRPRDVIAPAADFFMKHLRPKKQ